jgi:hypothetical protein
LFEGCFIVNYDFIEFELGFCARNFTHFDVIFVVAAAEVLSINFGSCVALTVSCFVFVIMKIILSFYFCTQVRLLNFQGFEK